MGIMDAFSAEDRVEVKFSQFYALMKDCTRAEMMENGLKCRIPHAHILAVVNGKAEFNITEDGKEKEDTDGRT